MKTEEQIKKLQAFKDYVHERLDKAGIEKEPNGEHSKAGCRIGDRLDIVLAPSKTISDEEIEQVAYDEASMHDWNDLRYKKSYIEGWKACGKWMQNKLTQ